MPSTPLDALAGVPNATQLTPTLIGGGQPTAQHLQNLKDAGGAVVVDLRDPMEPRPLDEPATVRELGMEYVNIPVSSGALTDAALDRILTTLREAEAGDRPVLLHCASGGRVGGAMIAYLMTEKGLSEDDAVAQAMQVGLRSAEMMEWGTSYAKRKLGQA